MTAIICEIDKGLWRIVIADGTKEVYHDTDTSKERCQKLLLWYLNGIMRKGEAR